MPHLYPPVPDLESLDNDGEREVLKQLVLQLPPAARIYHSLDLLTEEYRNGAGAKVRLKEGEIDIIVLLPDRSLVVVEVKGRGLRFRHDINQWQRNIDGKWLPEDSPFKQAKSNTHKLMECLKAQLGNEDVETISYGCMVVFPFFQIRGEPTHDMNPAVYCDASGMNQLGRQVERVAPKMASNAAARGSKAALSVLDIHSAILPEMRLVPSLRVSVDADVELLLRLTGEQADKLDMLSQRSRALVKGVAGSGKTVLAVEQARRFAAQDKKVLLLCYNSALARWISAGISDQLEESPVSGSVEVRTFHDFCASSCNVANIEFKPGEDQDNFWKEIAPELLLDSAQVNEKYDAIIVDEGQDFRGLWWLPIQEFLKADGALFVFCDPDQDIYDANGLSELNMDNDTFPLLKNCRNTNNIARFCDDIAGINTESHAQAPKGEDVVFETITCEESRVDYVRERLNDWVVGHDICPSKIAVLSPNRPDKTCLQNGISPSRVGLTNDAARWREGKEVLHTTVRGFKGLDAQFVILLDLPAPGTHPVFGWTDYYVGASRAVAVLHVVAKESGFERVDIAA